MFYPMNNGDLSTKKNVFDIAMLVHRFQDEVNIIVDEMHRHITSLEMQHHKLTAMVEVQCK